MNDLNDFNEFQTEEATNISITKIISHEMILDQLELNLTAQKLSAEKIISSSFILR